MVKKSISILIAVMFIMTLAVVPVSAADVETVPVVGGNIYVEDGVVVSADKKIVAVNQTQLSGANVTAIGPRAFKGCKSLFSLSIPDTVTKINFKGLMETYGLEKIQISEANTVYASINGNVYNKAQDTFLFCAPGTVSKRLVIPEGIKTIAANAFAEDYDDYYDDEEEYLINPLTMSLPDSVTAVNSSPFTLKKFEVASGNSKFATVGGALYSKDKKTLMIRPYGKYGAHYTVPNGTERIAKNAFYSNDYFYCVAIPKSVKSINSGVFYHNIPLEGVVGSTTVAQKFAKKWRMEYTTIPGKTTGAKAKAVGKNRVKVTWKQGAGVQGYEVYRATSKNGTYKLVNTVKSGKVTSYTNGKLKKGAKYYYRVRAYKVCRACYSSKVYGYFSAIKGSKVK